MRILSLVLLTLVCVEPAVGARELGSVQVSSLAHTIPIQIESASPQLAALANLAFATHGRYRIVGGGASLYQFRFSPAGATDVTVEITQYGNQPVASSTFSGRSLDQALFRAADFAVEKTNGLGLRGYFDSEIAFLAGSNMRKEVYVGNLFFTRFHRLTADGSDALFPRWSPDGTRLLFTSYRRGFPDIYQIDLSSYTLSTFESFKGTNVGARFSPDGRHVAMVLTGSSGNSQIWISDAEGHDLRQLTHFSSDKATPCWSPDGSRIVFASSPGPQLCIMSVYGGSPRRITYGFSAQCSEPDWNRVDPDKIAFTALEGNRYQVAVVSLSSGECTFVSRAPFDGNQPSWLPDGRHLVYTARDAYHSRLCILDTESGKSTPISPVRFGPASEANVWWR